MAGFGGRRPGAGRKPGVSKATLLKRNIQDHFNDEEIAKLLADAKEMAKTKPEMMKFLLEQIFGAAPRRIEMSGSDGSPLVIKWEQEG